MRTRPLSYAAPTDSLQRGPKGYVQKPTVEPYTFVDDFKRHSAFEARAEMGVGQRGSVVRRRAPAQPQIPKLHAHAPDEGEITTADGLETINELTAELPSSYSPAGAPLCLYTVDPNIAASTQRGGLRKINNEDAFAVSIPLGDEILDVVIDAMGGGGHTLEVNVIILEGLYQISKDNPTPTLYQIAERINNLVQAYGFEPNEKGLKPGAVICLTSYKRLETGKYEVKRLPIGDAAMIGVAPNLDSIVCDSDNFAPARYLDPNSHKVDAAIGGSLPWDPDKIIQVSEVPEGTILISGSDGLFKQIPELWPGQGNVGDLISILKYHSITPSSSCEEIRKALVNEALLRVELSHAWIAQIGKLSQEDPALTQEQVQKTRIKITPEIYRKVYKDLWLQEPPEQPWFYLNHEMGVNVIMQPGPDGKSKDHQMAGTVFNQQNKPVARFSGDDITVTVRRLPALES